MDKKLLESFDNLSRALEDIAAALKSKSEAQSATAQALQQGNFLKEIKDIGLGVKQLLKDTKKIMADQQTILKMAKSSGKQSDVTSELGKDKKKQGFFKEGIGVIMLIAVAVLALGVAFKMIGNVNFLSVIALSLALPLLAIGFQKVLIALKQTGFNAKRDGLNFVVAMVSFSLALTLSSKILSMVSIIPISKMITIILLAGGFTLLAPAIGKIIRAFKGMSFFALAKTVLFLPLILPAVALGIALSSWVFQLVRPVSISAVMTTIFIALAFTVISYGLRKLMKSFKRIGFTTMMKAIKFLPLVLPAIALGIALSSYALQLVKPIGLAQLFTTIMISIAFAAISFGLGKLLKAFKGITPARAAMAAIMLPLVLIAISYAIAKSSEYFQQIKPIGFAQFLTALGISIVFVVISFAAKFIIRAISRMKWTDVPKIPVFFVLVSIAIWQSSIYISKTKVIEFMTMLKIAIYSVVLAIAVIAIGAAMWLLKKMGVGLKDAIIGSLLIVIVSVAIMLSSKILNLGEYKNYPSWKWALGVGLSLIAFVPAIALLGLIATSGVGALALLAGSAMVLVVAGTIVLVSKILKKGDYSKYPSPLWTLGVGLALVPFAIGIIALGALALTGIGALAFIAGIPMILSDADSIVEVSKKLQKGRYDNAGRMLVWALGTTLLFATFVPMLILLGTVGLASAVVSFFGPDPWKMATKMILQVAESIVGVSFILSKGEYKGGPTKEWAGGVALALGAFSPLYAMLMANGVMKIFGGGGIGPDDYAKAIKTVSEGIIYAAKLFASPDNPGVWKGGPPKEWAEGVGQAIGAFSPVLSILSQGAILKLFGGEGVSPAAMKGAIKTISEGIVEAAKFFAENSAPFKDNYPKKEWGEGVGAALGAFAPVFTRLKEGSGWFTSGKEVIQDMKFAITQIAGSLVDAALAFTRVTPEAWKSYPSPDWSKGVADSVNGFMELFKNIEERGYSVESFLTYTQIVNSALTSMSLSAAILFNSKKFFSDGVVTQMLPWTIMMRTSVLIYAKLAKELESQLSSKEISSIGIGSFSLSRESTKMSDLSLTNKVVSQMSQTAAILYKSRKLFEFKIDPGYMKRVAANVKDFAGLVKFLNQSNVAAQTGVKGLLGLDPVSKTAQGMVKMASAFDTLARSLTRFSTALKTVDKEKVNIIRKLTANIAILASMDSVMFNKMLTVLESRASVFGKLLDVQGRSADMRARPNVGDRPGGETRTVWTKKTQDQGPVDGKGENALVKLDKISDLLGKITKVIPAVDEYIGFAVDSAKKQEKALKKISKKESSPPPS